MIEALTGMGLSAAAGLNAYIPFLVVALAARFTDVITLPTSLMWIESGWAIGIGSVLLLAEIVLDKIPAVDTINAPPFPRPATWINVASLRLDQQRGRPVLVEFFDICRVNSMRTLPYVQAWHERYEADGLRVVQVHTPDPALDSG